MNIKNIIEDLRNMVIGGLHFRKVKVTKTSIRLQKCSI